MPPTCAKAGTLTLPLNFYGMRVGACASLPLCVPQEASARQTRLLGGRMRERRRGGWVVDEGATLEYRCEEASLDILYRAGRVPDAYHDRGAYGCGRLADSRRGKRDKFAASQFKRGNRIYWAVTAGRWLSRAFAPLNI